MAKWYSRAVIQYTWSR